MTLQELKSELGKYMYMEDTGMIDVSLAAIIATRLKLGNPIWMIIIGPSSSGKSQILRPLAMTDSRFIHRVDDLTENTFLSGMNTKTSGNVSLLSRIGAHGMMVISDLTVLFSRAPESRSAILSQFRMIYDGEMSKMAGNQDKPITWKGYLGILAGSTPSLYRLMEEVSDMGERFMYYRLKDYDVRKAMMVAVSRTVRSSEIDEVMTEKYTEYLKDIISGWADMPIGTRVDVSDKVRDDILEISMFAEKIRTVGHYDWKGSTIKEIPVTAMPTRIALQLITLAKGMMILQKLEGNDELTYENITALSWCGYSLANEEKRACLKVICRTDFDKPIRTQTIADGVGLSTDVINSILQILASTGVLIRAGDERGLTWKMSQRSEYNLVRRMEGMSEVVEYKERELSGEDGDETDVGANEFFNRL